jgi:hypothetical protein
MMKAKIALTTAVCALLCAGHAPAAGALKKLRVALGGMVWSGACFLRLFNRGPLANDRRVV